MAANDDSKVLALVADIQGLVEIDEFRYGLLRAIDRAVPSDHVSLNEVGHDRESVASIVRPVLDPAAYEVYARLAQENPLLRHYLATGDGRATRFSDVTSTDELHGLAIYRELYSWLGVEYQMAFTLPGRRDRVLAIALSRRTGDYTNAERDVVNAARPFVIQAYHNSVEYDRARAARRGSDAAALMAPLRGAGLTEREAEVVRLVALGGSNRDIAASLAISDRTIAKHLEHAFHKLGVPNRSAAAARAWELSGP